MLCTPGSPAVSARIGHCATNSAAASTHAGERELAERAPESRASKPMKPARRPNQRISAKLTQAPIAVASASPTCASVGEVEEHDLQRDVDGDRRERRLDGRRGVAARQERRDDAAHQHERDQPDRVGGKRPGRRLRVRGGEFPAHEQRAHDQVGHDQECRDAGDREQQRERDRARLRGARARIVAGREPPRHFGQQHGADRDADHAAGQLIEPVGVVERRERAGREEARDDGVGEQRKLHAGRADRRRPERLEEALHVVVELRAAQRGHHVGAQRRAADQQHFEHAGDQHAPRGGVARRSETTPRSQASPPS